MRTRLLKGCRWLLLLILISWALIKGRELGFSLPKLPWSSAHVSILLFLGLMAHVVQAGMTKAICFLCSVKIGLLRCLSLNVVGGLWGLLMPMGSVGYKTVALKRDHNLKPSRYASYYVLSALANLWTACLVLLPLGVWAKLDLYLRAVMVLFLISPALLFISQNILRKVSFFDRRLGHRTLGLVRFFSTFFILAGIQLMGALVYLSIYALALSWLDAQAPMSAVAVVVLMQSLLFLAPIVPGNAVVLEGAGMWWLGRYGVEPSIGVSAMLMMRFTVFGVLVTLSPWAFFQVKRT
jgi:hypothetical protein